MRLKELSERSGVSVATIKYYLREGLLPAGQRVTATQADYDEEHLRRLRLVRAMIQVGRVPVTTAREVLTAVDDESLSRTMRLGAALWALPQNRWPEPEERAGEAAKDVADTLLERLGWLQVREIGDLSPVYRSLVNALATLKRLGIFEDAEQLLPYGRHMAQVAEVDLDQLEALADDKERTETAVAAAVLFEPMLRDLRRLAQEELSMRRYGH